MTSELETTVDAVDARDVRLSYRDSVALDSASITIPSGSYTCLLGPSGSGKTTLLRVIAGLATPGSGIVRIHGDDLANVPPERRDIGVVFQDYALFPHMTVFDNIAYPLKVRRVDKRERARVVESLLERMQLQGKGRRFPGELSGGERQRVAVARALAFRPKMLLLDEPLAALDKNLRASVQRQLRELQREYRITFVHVTHDQGEAMALADQLVVMRGGRIAQCGSSEEIYRRPVDAFVAEFLGESNLVAGDVEGRGENMKFRSPVWAGAVDAAHVSADVEAGPARLLLRPDDARLNAPRGDSVAIEGCVAECEFQGGYFEVLIETSAGMIAIRTNEPLPTGTRHVIHWAHQHIFVLGGDR